MASTTAPAKGASTGKKSASVLELLGLLVVWYSSSAVAGSSTRRILNGWPAPLALCAVQFSCATLLGLTLIYGFKWSRPCSLSSSEWASLGKVALAYGTGFVSLTSTMVFVTVSLSETFRAGEPIFSVAFTRLVLGESVGWAVLASLVPIVGGIGLAVLGSSTTISPLGATMAFLSNTCFSIRSVWTKALRRQLSGNGKSIEDFTLVCYISGCSFVLVVVYSIIASLLFSPASVVGDASGLQAVADAMFPSLPAGLVRILCLLAVNSVAFATYNQCSYMVLSRTHIITHAIGNGMRRVVTIVASILYFGTAVSPVNAFGMCLAIAGVLMYIRARQSKPAAPAAAAPAEGKTHTS